MKEIEDLDNIDHRLWHRLERLQVLAMRYMHAQFGDRMARGRDASRGQGRVLKALSLVKDPISQKDLMEVLDMRQQSLAELLSKLEAKGYITRTPSPEDRRKQIVELTDEGRAAADAVPDADPNIDFFDCLTDDEKANLEDYLTRLAESLEQKWEEETPRCGRRARPAPPFGFGRMPRR